MDREAEEEMSGILRSQRRVLIVDDEPTLCFTLRLVLEEEYQVVVAESGKAAIATLTEDSDFDVVLCDLQMPGVSGADVFEWAASRALGPRFVFMTGGAYSREAEDFLARPDVTSVNKPFDVDDLLRVVDSVAATRAAALRSAVGDA